MSRMNNSGFSIGKRRGASPQRFTPTVRGVSGANPALASASSRNPNPSVRGAATGASGSRNRNTPGLRGTSSKKNDRLAPAKGQVLSEGKVNGIHVRVSAPKAPNPDNSGVRMVDTTARERNVQPDLPPDMMASQSTQMIAGMNRGSRPRVQQLERPAEPEPPRRRRPARPVVDVEAVEVEPTSEAPTGAYWSDKYERYVAPGEAEYSAETAARMGVG